GARVGNFRRHACQQMQTLFVELVGDAVMDHGQNTGVAQQNLVDASRGGVALVGRQNVGVEQPSDFGQCLGEGIDTGNGFVVDAGGNTVLVTGLVGQLKPNLMQQG